MLLASDVVSGSFVLAGVVLGALVTYVLGRRTDALRLADEDERRWRAERRGIYARYLALCGDLLRDIDGTGVFLSYDGTEPISDEDEGLIHDRLYEALGRWDDELQPMLSDVQLMASPAVSDLADRAAFAIMETTAPIETRATFVDYYPVWFQARDLVQVLRNAMRTELGLPRIDQGPVRDPEWPWLPDRPPRESYVQDHPSREPRR